MSLIITSMGNHLRAAITVSKSKSMGQTNQRLVYNKTYNVFIIFKDLSRNFLISSSLNRIAFDPVINL